MDNHAEKDATNTILGLCITFPVLAVLAVAGRFYSRRLKVLALGADDWLILVAAVLVIGKGTTGFVGVYLGDLGKHQPIGPQGYPIISPKIEVFQKVNYASQLIDVVGLTCAKLSVLFFYRRIFWVGRFKWAFFITMALNLLWGFCFFFTFLLQCIPVDQIWKTVRGQRRPCVSVRMYLPFSYSGAILDCIVITLPIPMVLRMQMPKRQKFAVLCIFLLGSISVAASIAKAVAFSGIVKNLKTIHDTTYILAPTFYWTIPELCVAVIAACLPTLRPIFHGWSPESIVGSIRSIITLRSLESEGNRSNRGIREGYVRSGDESGEVITGMAKPSTDEGFPEAAANHRSMPIERLPRAESAMSAEKSFTNEG